MTTPAPQPGSHREPEQVAVAAAEAAGTVLPASEPLTAPGAQPGTAQVTGLFAGAVVADLGGPLAGVLGVLVAEDLVSALASSPLGDLELPAAIQPALDAAAASMGASVGAARQVGLDAVVAAVAGSADAPFTVVPLVGESIAAALLVSAPTLASAAAGAPAPASAGAAVQAAVQAPVPPPVTTPQVPAGQTFTPAPRRGIELLSDVDMEVTVELGRTRMAMRDLLALSPGHVLELDRAAGSPADLLVNGHLIARGEVVVVDEDFGLRVTEILESSTAS
ncbi:flagellar motor switch protein FliN [Nocardioides pantholopis]|uniref:flagellar motor switch protein FliN n=1 Tax=Nocardioides pantholopis TaxID=2483798 RepID=UPI000F089BD9|nr:flagellar motor switch protein FliN [Nocardioides pantholopis]